VQGQRPIPAGFGNCANCAYLESGPASVCYGCASRSFEKLADNRCELCERPLEQNGTCRNPICTWSESERWFRWIWAISMRTGPLKRAIDRYKVNGKVAWATIFGRVLLGYLSAQRAGFDRYDLIVPSPTFIGRGGRPFDHTGTVVARAMLEDDANWPFALGVVEKTAPTTPFRGRTWEQRRRIAETELRGSLHVCDPARARDARILVYDDVYTEGLTIREIARSLRLAGATEVSQIVLARQPWIGK
jgi:predicted amidophosphoribosyltransferase